MGSNIVQYIKNADITVGIIPEIGGTIVYLSKSGSSNLIKSNPDLWDIAKKPKVDEHTDFVSYNGHTVWLGPQKEWWIHQSVNLDKKQSKADWPPDPYLYISEFSVTHKTENVIRMCSPHSPISGVTIEKEIAVNPDGSVLIMATVKNTGKEVCAWDVWHNTRFDGKCKVFVPAEEKNIKVVPVLNENSTEMPYVVQNDFFSYNPQLPPVDFQERSSKTFVYPKSPNIYVFSENNMVNVSFTLHNQYEIHPEQGLVEIYNHTEHDIKNDLLEVEYHSPYKKLEVGESMQSWEVWQVYDCRKTETDLEKIELIEKL